MPRKTKKRSKKKRGGEIKTYTKNEAKNKVRKDYDKFLKILQNKYNIYVGSDLVSSSERIHKNNLFKEMCKEEGVEPSDIDSSVNTFEELFNKHKFSDIIKMLFKTLYISSREIESALNGGENTSPNTKAARTIQSRFRGNKDRKYVATKKELKNLRDNDVFNMINMHYKNKTGKDLSGRGKKKKSKNKKRSKKYTKKHSIKRGGS